MNLQFGWQDVLAAAVVVWAVWYLGRRVFGVVRRDAVTGCGPCPGCGGDSKRSDKSRQGFVPVESLLGSAEERSVGAGE